MPLAPGLLAEDGEDPATAAASATVGGQNASSTSASWMATDDSAATAAAALAAAYPTAFPRVLPSGCAFEASLDGMEFEAVPDAVSLTGLGNGKHRFSVRCVCACSCVSFCALFWGRGGAEGGSVGAGGGGLMWQYNYFLQRLFSLALLCFALLRCSIYMSIGIVVL